MGSRFDFPSAGMTKDNFGKGSPKARESRLDGGFYIIEGEALKICPFMGSTNVH